jgi:hypothetical protein
MAGCKSVSARHAERVMKLSACLALILSASAALGMSSTPKVTVRFHSEANKNDTSSFATPIKLAYAQREAHINRVPEFSERNIKAIYPWKTRDGTWGCAFKLNESGRIRLETISSDNRGAAIVAFIGTKKGMHQVIDMVIDRPINDGIVAIPRGITDIEMLVLRKQFKVLGEQPEKKEKKKEEQPQEPIDWRMDRSRDSRSSAPPMRAAKLPPLPEEAPRKKSSRVAPEPDLPRVAD